MWNDGKKVLIHYSIVQITSDPVKNEGDTKITSLIQDLIFRRKK